MKYRNKHWAYRSVLDTIRKRPLRSVDISATSDLSQPEVALYASQLVDMGCIEIVKTIHTNNAKQITRHGLKVLTLLEKLQKEIGEN